MNMKIYIYIGSYVYTHRHKYMQTNRISLTFILVIL